MPILKLIRFPNVFTAISNIWAGFLVANDGLFQFNKIFILSMTSACVYSGCIAFNDYCDREYDKFYHPARPIPKGEVSGFLAVVLSFILLSLGIFIGSFISLEIIYIVCGIIFLAVLYNIGAKKYLISGMLLISLCRGFNWLIGLVSTGNFSDKFLIFPFLLMIYVAVIFLVSRKEEKNPLASKVVKIFISFIPVLDGLFVLSLGYSWQALVVMSLVFPIFFFSRFIEMT